MAERLGDLRLGGEVDSGDNAKKGNDEVKPGTIVETQKRVRSLLEAAKGGSVKDLESAVQQFEDENKGDAALTLKGVRDANGRSTLHFAALHGNQATCAYILKACPG